MKTGQIVKVLKCALTWEETIPIFGSRLPRDLGCYLVTKLGRCDSVQIASRTSSLAFDYFDKGGERLQQKFNVWFQFDTVCLSKKRLFSTQSRGTRLESTTLQPRPVSASSLLKHALRAEHRNARIRKPECCTESMCFFESKQKIHDSDKMEVKLNGSR